MSKTFRELLGDLLLCATIGYLVALAIIAALSCADASGQTVEPCLPLGTVLLSRNADERENTSPGYYNHAAIVVGVSNVVESQADRGVIRTAFEDYFARDYKPVLAFKPKDAEAGRRAAARAVKLIGTPHRMASSVRRCPNGQCRIERGVNCVTAAVEVPWSPEDRRVSCIIRPDGMFRPRLTKKIFLPPEVVK